MTNWFLLIDFKWQKNRETWKWLEDLSRPKAVKWLVIVVSVEYNKLTKWFVVQSYNF